MMVNNNPWFGGTQNDIGSLSGFVFLYDDNNELQRLIQKCGPRGFRQEKLQN
jgi:hypothetical protein